MSMFQYGYVHHIPVLEIISGPLLTVGQESQRGELPQSKMGPNGKWACRYLLFAVLLG